MKTAAGVVRQPQPTTWQIAPTGERTVIACRYRLLGERRFGFDVPAADPKLPTVIDPALQWATYLGGADMDVAEALALAPDGDVLTTGFTMCFDPFDIDVFIARFTPDGKTLISQTFLDGGNIDGAFGIGVDRSGIVTVAGQTFSSGFPITENAFQSSFGGFADGFVVQLTPELELLYSTRSRLRL